MDLTDKYPWFKTNNHIRYFIDYTDLPPNVLNNDFDYMTESELEQARFLKYKGQYYCLNEFIRSSQLDEWDGYYALTVFSAVLIKIIDDDSYIICYSYW